MIKKLKKTPKNLKVILIFFCLAVFAIKFVCASSPLFVLNSSFTNTFRKYKAGFSEPFIGHKRIMTDIFYKNDRGKNGILHTFFDKSLIGFSTEKFDSVYYTLPLDSIINILKTDDLNNLFPYAKTFSENTNSFLFIPALFTLDLNRDMSFNSLTDIFSEVKLISKNTSLFSSQKSFTYAIPSKTITDVFDTLLLTETNEEKKIKSYLLNFVNFQNSDYLVDIKIKDKMVQKIRCITPDRGGCSYYVEAVFNYPSLNFTVGSVSGNNQKCVFRAKSKFYDASGDKAIEVSISGEFLGQRNNLIVFDLFPDKISPKRKYKEKSIYSLTLGEVFELCKAVVDA